LKKKTKVTKKLPVKNVAVAVKPVATLPVKPIVPAPVTTIIPIAKKHTLYVEVTPDKYFVLCDGRKVKSGKELADILQLISDDMFKYHVTDTKNDFSNWINDVFGEPDLAKKLRTVRNRFETSIEIYRCMFNKLEKSIKK
jgi:hypothetical protein